MADYAAAEEDTTSIAPLRAPKNEELQSSFSPLLRIEALSAVAKQSTVSCTVSTYHLVL
jgi:hypothetical protein